MKKPPAHSESLRNCLGAASECEGRFLWAAESCVALADLTWGTSLDVLPDLLGRSVLLATHNQFAAALAIIGLDGVARRLIVCPPDLDYAHLSALIAKADVDAIVSDFSPRDLEPLGVPLHVQANSFISSGCLESDSCQTEWILLTSGTTGVPKMLAHSLTSLTAAIKKHQHPEKDVVWGTFYDIRRYGGLQIFLRALLGRGSLILSNAGESPNDHLIRLAAHSVTHLTGTPSHWRRALMSPAARTIKPRYVRLSGEIADQSILNTLRAFYPSAVVAHAFASTEAGVAFEVNDCLEGFPANFLGVRGEVEMKVEDDSLRIRSNRTANRYVGEQTLTVMDAEGFLDTGDIVELRGDRYYFLGRRNGVINVGGLKVHPEEIEALLNSHPAIRISRVRSRPNPITGSLVVADIVLKDGVDCANGQRAQLQSNILRLCRETLPRHKVPATLNFVSSVDVAATGKMARQYA